MDFRFVDGDRLIRDEALKTYMCAVLDEKPDKIYDILNGISSDQVEGFMQMLKNDIEGRVPRLIREVSK